jgi:endonuclease/exonuclease/phosphatase family metal-dependent hydrolase
MNIFKLFSWNIRQGGGKRIEKQVEVIDIVSPDVIALQEMTIGSIGKYRAELNNLGFKYSVDTFQLSTNQIKLIGPRRYGLLIASKWPLNVLKPLDIPWEERVLGAEIDSPFGVIEVYNTHIPPGSSNGWIKIDTFEGIYRNLSKKTKNHRILCGDFNSPQIETVEGNVITWGQKLSIGQKWHISKGNERWDEGERSVLEGLSNFDIKDVFRSLYGYSKEEYSFYLKYRQKVFQRRFDHCFASETLNPVKFNYLHEPREQKLSDHSAVEVLFKPHLIDD